MPIQLLPISLANQIAAGEVIERPSSVVKELIENSLDSGADQLFIDIEKGGRRRIRIRDNGSGIDKDELALALARHATSKITSLADLEAIQSLGFRGEALASISSVSRLTLTSKPAQQTQAWQAWVEGRDMQAQLTPASHPDGTTVDVEDLFFNTPARRKFLRTDKTEFSHIDEMLKRIALSRFDVKMVIQHNQKVVRQYPAVAQERALERIAKVVGSSFSDTAEMVDNEHFGLRLWGWVAPPEACRHQGDVQFLYVNGRMMRDRLLNHAIRQAYGDTLGDDRSPTYVLYLELPPAEVDVNVHPAKHEVRFHHARQVHDFVLQSLRGVARGATSNVAPHQYQAASVQLQQQVAALQPRYNNPLPGVAAAPSAPTIEPAPAPQSASILAVLQQRFALLEHAGQLVLLHLQEVEQAYLVRQLQRQHETGLSGQPLLIPVKLTDKQLSAAITELPLARLAQLGVVYRKVGRQVVIEQVPSALRHSDIHTSMVKLVSFLADSAALAPEFWQWLAQQQVSTHYSKVQAEHWAGVWLEQLQGANKFVTRLQLPELPEPIR